MRTIGVAFGTGAIAILSATAAQAETWCIRDSGGLGIAICAFSSAQDCVRAAVISPAAGSCAIENPAPSTATDPSSGKRRTRHHRQADY